MWMVTVWNRFLVRYEDDIFCVSLEKILEAFYYFCVYAEQDDKDYLEKSDRIMDSI